MARLLPLALLLLWAACAPPPDELYNRGQQLELEGRYEEAVDHYVRALEREPTMRKAQGRLHVAGGLLLARYLATADGAAPPEAADALLAAGALLERTAAVGVPLDAPPTFAADLTAALDAAVEFLITEGAGALEAGAFGEALAAFDRARRYGPNREQDEALHAFTYDTHIAWADAEFAAGRYRAAYDRAESARPYAAAGSDRTSEEVNSLQAAALDAGSLFVAAFPVEARRGRDRAAMPPGFLDELDDLLTDEHWAAAPPFLRLTDPADVRRLLRRYDDPDDRLDHPRLTADLAEDLLAGFGVASTLERYVREAEITDRDSVTVDLRGGGRGTYARLRERVTLGASIDWAVVTVGRAGLLCEGTAEAEARGTLARGAYRGRAGDLVLPRADRALFDEEALREAETEIERDLQARLAERLAGQVFDCLLRQVP